LRRGRHKARQNVVALTQTEIMFVFAAIILILLQVKQVDNDRLRGDYEELAQRAEAVEQERESAPFEEVKRTLVRSGALEEQEGLSAEESQNRVLRKIRDLARPAEDRVEPDEQVKSVLRRASADEIVQPGQGELEQLEEVLRLARIGKQAEAEREESAAAEGAGGEASSGEGARSSADAARRKVADKVGFNPCWPKISGETYSYHRTFSMEYDRGTDRFRIEPDWDEGAPLVSNALDGPLALLREHPQGWIGRDEFARYSIEVSQQAARAYGPGCKLVTKINDAGRDAILFVARYFFPIY